jgi:hypothetical protein
MTNILEKISNENPTEEIIENIKTFVKEFNIISVKMPKKFSWIWKYKSYIRENYRHPFYHTKYYRTNNSVLIVSSPFIGSYDEENFLFLGFKKYNKLFNLNTETYIKEVREKDFFPVLIFESNYKEHNLEIMKSRLDFIKNFKVVRYAEKIPKYVKISVDLLLKSYNLSHSFDFNLKNKDINVYVYKTEKSSIIILSTNIDKEDDLIDLGYVKYNRLHSSFSTTYIKIIDNPSC